MNLATVMKEYADQIGGTFTEYDQEKSIVIVPLKDNRFQTVLAVTEKSRVSGKVKAIFKSKVCDLTEKINTMDLLSKHSHFDYSKFTNDDNQLKIEASCLVDSTTEEELKAMLQEVAQLADHYEYQFTGKDIH